METNKKEYSFEKRKIKVKEEIANSNTQSLSELSQLEKLDNTNPEVIISLLRYKKTNKLLFNNFDVLNKQELSEFDIKKNLDNRELYFYFLDYICHVKIIDEQVDYKKEVKSMNKATKEPELFIDFSEGKVSIKKNNKYQKEIKDNSNSESNNDIEDEKNEKQYEEAIRVKIGLIIEKNFPMNEKISINALRQKIYKYFYDFIHLEKHKNNFPEFQSELFFHYQLKNVLKTFLELNDNDFKKKIDMIYNLDGFISKIKKKEIKDLIILNYFYFIIDIEYELNISFKTFLYYNEKIQIFKNTTMKDNKLIFDNCSIIIENYDYYNLNESDIQFIKDGIIKLPLDKGFKNLKGELLSREFSSKDINIIYDKLLPSELIKDIINILYGKTDDIFGSKNVIKLFKENTFYFPINNLKYAAYTNKDCFKIFIDNKILSDLLYIIISNLSEKIKHLIKKAFLIINIEHEFGHTHKLILFPLDNDIDFFNSPLVKIKFSIDKEIEIDEGGEFFEYLLYGRIINGLNIKEIIYINNMNNFSKNLCEFRKGFLDLEKETLEKVFVREAQNNIEIKEALEEYMKMSKEDKHLLDSIEFKSGKSRKNFITKAELETMIFSIGKIRAPHKYVINNFTCD